MTKPVMEYIGTYFSKDGTPIAKVYANKYPRRRRKQSSIDKKRREKNDKM